MGEGALPTLASFVAYRLIKVAASIEQIKVLASRDAIPNHREFIVMNRIRPSSGAKTSRGLFPDPGLVMRVLQNQPRRSHVGGLGPGGKGGVGPGKVY